MKKILRPYERQRTLVTKAARKIKSHTELIDFHAHSLEYRVRCEAAKSHCFIQSGTRKSTFEPHIPTHTQTNYKQTAGVSSRRQNQHINFRKHAEIISCISEFKTYCRQISEVQIHVLMQTDTADAPSKRLQISS